MKRKAWYKSKTIWANIVAFVVTMAGVFGLDVEVTQETQAQIVAGVMAVVNVVLRLATDSPVGAKDDPA